MFAAQDFTLIQTSLLSVSAAIIWFAISSFRSWYRLRHIPGPFLASFSYLWLARVASSGRQYDIYRDLCNEYGPLVRVGPNELTTDDPEVIRKMSAARSSYGKDQWYLGARFNPYFPTMFTTLDPVVHDTVKTKTAGAYSGREASALEPGVDAQVNDLLTLIRRKYVSEPGTKELRLLDFAQLSSFFTLDVITRAGFGKEFGYLNADCDLYDFLSGIRDHWPKLAITVDVPWIRAILYSPSFLKCFGPRVTDAAGMGKLMRIANDIVGKRFAQTRNSESDMLESFIRHGLTQGQCETEGLFMVIAGSDTTASTMRITMLHIMSVPRVYQKFKAEIANAVRKGVSSPITVEEAKKIPYLQAIIYEGLRMRAPAPGLYPKSVPAEGDVIHGKMIPGGTAIGMNTSSLLRSKKVFGEDADLFRPERFIEADEATRIAMERDIELVFGYGRWMCAGKPVALMELNKVFFELLRAFDFQLVNPIKPLDSRSFSVFVEENMWVKVTDAHPV